MIQRPPRSTLFPCTTLFRSSTASARRARARWPTSTPSTTSSAAASGCRRPRSRRWRSEEHTSELQPRKYLVSRLLLEKKINRDPSLATDDVMELHCSSDDYC